MIFGHTSMLTSKKEMEETISDGKTFIKIILADNTAVYVKKIQVILMVLGIFEKINIKFL